MRNFQQQHFIATAFDLWQQLSVVDYSLWLAGFLPAYVSNNFFVCVFVCLYDCFAVVVVF